jgi:hypothetical protein
MVLNYLLSIELNDLITDKRFMNEKNDLEIDMFHFDELVKAARIGTF